MENVFSQTLDSLNRFNAMFIKLFPQDLKQVAWNISMAVWMNKGPLRQDFKSMFYATYERCLESLTSLRGYISGLHETFQVPLGYEQEPEYYQGKEHYMELAATEIQRLLRGFMKSFVPEEFIRECETLAAQCAELCKHFESFRQAEEKEKREPK